jgi:hypothetical protein
MKLREEAVPFRVCKLFHARNVQTAFVLSELDFSPLLPTVSDEPNRVLKAELSFGEAHAIRRA